MSESNQGRKIFSANSFVINVKLQARIKINLDLNYILYKNLNKI
jgi:hypothetical protein